SADENGALMLDGTTSITNSTISGNSGVLGAVVNVADYSGSSPGDSSRLTIASSTFANNGINIPTINQGVSATTSVQSSIFGHRSTSAPNMYTTNSETLISLGHNLVDDSSIGFTNGSNGDSVGTSVAALLDPTLANNGGPTKTHKLLAG